MFDVDIDVAPSMDKSKYGTIAMIHNSGVVKKHNSGYYYNLNMPVDGETGLAALDYKVAEDLGYIKVDLLNNNAYSNIRSMYEYNKLLEQEPVWELLWTEPDFVGKLPQVGNHFKLLKRLQPRSIMELADALALIRPAKRKYVESYLKNRVKIRPLIYKKDGDKYYFKKSHAVMYAHMIVVVMNNTVAKPIESFFTLNR